MSFIRSLKVIFTYFSVLITIVILIGAYRDYQDFSPADFGESGNEQNQDLFATGTGIVQRGRVMDHQLDCSKGMIYIELYQFRIPFRKVSSTGIDMEKPREACRARGFAPTF